MAPLACGSLGCAFYEVTHEECLDSASPEECGLGSGGLAGASSGGSVGGAAGGTPQQSSGGSLGGASRPPLPRINEVKAEGRRFVEIYNAGDAPVSAGDVYVTAGTSAPDDANRCGLPEISPRSLAVADVSEEGVCGDLEVPCRTCDFRLAADSPSSTIYLQDEAGKEIARLKYPEPDESVAPSVVESWAAIPDGSDSFRRRNPSPGELNGESSDME